MGSAENRLMSTFKRLVFDQFETGPEGKAERVSIVPFVMEGREVQEGSITTLAIKPIAGHGNTREERCQSILAQILSERPFVHHFNEVMNAVYLYRPKQGQDPYKMFAEAKHEMVGMYGTKHNHDDTNLYDIQFVRVFPGIGAIDVMPFDRHTPIYIPNSNHPEPGSART